jgi:CheY-like chemotaxis protein
VSNWIQKELKISDMSEKKESSLTETNQDNLPENLSETINAKGGKQLKVLIAEDDENSAMFLYVIFENHFKEIIMVKTGLEAVKACQSHPDTDLIMMDVRMPEMNGYDATRKIREFNKKVIIIAQTAFGIRGEIEKARAISVGCNDYLSKPIEVDILKEMIEKHLGKMNWDNF